MTAHPHTQCLQPRIRHITQIITQPIKEPPLRIPLITTPEPHPIRHQRLNQQTPHPRSSGFLWPAILLHPKPLSLFLSNPDPATAQTVNLLPYPFFSSFLFSVLLSFTQNSSNL
jgi:hypothetical protein